MLVVSDLFETRLYPWRECRQSAYTFIDSNVLTMSIGERYGMNHWCQGHK